MNAPQAKPIPMPKRQPPAGFHLRNLVGEIVRDSAATDPGDLVTEVIARIPKKKVADALKQTMRLYVRQVISETRPIGGGEPPVAATSWKVTAIRDGWQRQLTNRLHVGAGKWKRLADCTYDDLLAVAAERRDLAERNGVWARTYESWARLISEAGVDTFGELPVERQAAALGRAA